MAASLAILRPGDFVMMLDGEGCPRFIWRTTDATIKPLSQSIRRLLGTRGRATVPETRGSTPIAATSLGKRAEIDDDIPTVFERFEVVWPLDVARCDHRADN